MDEGVGALIVIVLVIGAVIWVVGAIVKAIISILMAVFLGGTYVLGHAAFVVIILAALGAFGGLLFHRSKTGVQAARTDDDFAQVGVIRLLPAGWATLMIFSFIGVVALYGMVFL
jgi:hypothetical protein